MLIWQSLPNLTKPFSVLLQCIMFNMKCIEKEKAIILRQEGKSITYIAGTLGVAKSSVSNWVKVVKLSDNQLSTLRNNSHTTVAIEKRRLARLTNEENKRQLIINAAYKNIKGLSLKELWLIGIMLYWAEGGKTQRLVRFSNGDPEMIRIMMKFFRLVCKVPESKFRGYIHIHPTLDHLQAEAYWSNIASIPKEQFFKTYRKKNISSNNKRNSLPFGVFDIYVLDTKLFLKISGWALGIFNSATEF